MAEAGELRVKLTVDDRVTPVLRRLSNGLLPTGPEDRINNAFRAMCGVLLIVLAALGNFTTLAVGPCVVIGLGLLIDAYRFHSEYFVRRMKGS